MNDETKNRLTQLVEINRALAHDLDVSRRIVAELGGERDALKERLEKLETDAQIFGAGEERGQGLGGSAKIMGELNQVKSFVKEVSEERDYALRGVEAATARAKRAEEKLFALSSKLRELEMERDVYLLKVNEMAEAMSEIRFRLAELPRTEFMRDLGW